MSGVRDGKPTPNVNDAPLADPQSGTLADALAPGYRRYQDATNHEGLPTEPNESVPVRNAKFGGSGMKGRAPGLPGA